MAVGLAVWILVLLLGLFSCALVRLPLWLTSLALTAWLGILVLTLHNSAAILTGLAGILILLVVNRTPIRKHLLTQPLFRWYRKVLPEISETEKEALAAGTVWWEGEFFNGRPQWTKLLNTPKPTLREEERRFLEGPVEKLCGMLDDWKITHEWADLPPPVWDFLKSQGFFALIIPPAYGGLGFSSYAHSEILVKIGSRSTTAASVVAVPNSLGPAELLLHYGTPEQKSY